MRHIITLEYTTRTPSLNRWQRMHWTKQSAVSKRLWFETRAQVPARMRNATLKRRVVITRHSPRELDHDNLVGGCKALVDALVKCGLIVDDSPTWVEVEYRQAKGQGVTVEVYE